MMKMMTEQLLLASMDKHAHYISEHAQAHSLCDGALGVLFATYCVYIYRILHCKQSVSFYELAECPLTSAAAKEGVSIHLTPLALIATLRYYA